VSVWPEAVESWAAADLEYRFQWTFPLAVSPHGPRPVFAGSQHVHRTLDGGESWEVISPDLTSADPELMRRTGGLTLDDAGPTLAPTIFALAVSPLEEGQIWAGTNDGRVHLTRDGGESWTDLTDRLPPDVPARGTISNVEPSPHEPGTAYLTVDRHQLGDSDPYVLRTRDFGKSWERIDGGIPRTVFSYAHCVREDPARVGLLYLGTENAVWLSLDDGARWHELRSNLPHAPVHWLTVQERFGDLVVATYGRGFWILDDLTPLREIGRSLPTEKPTLLPPRDAWRFREVAETMSQPDDPAAGENPEYGALLHYYLPEAVPEDAMFELEILDAPDEVVAMLDDLPREPGLHRVPWDLQSEKTREVHLRTKPVGHPWVDIPDDEGWRPLKDGGRISLLTPPGAYTVRLVVGDTVESRPLTVLKDPHSEGNLEDVTAQLEITRDLWAMQDSAAATVNELEWIRKQLEDLRRRVDDTPRDDAKELVERIAALDATAREIESAFFDLRFTGHGQDSLRWQRRLYAKLAYLAWQIAGSDHRPTRQHLEVHAKLREELADVTARFQEFSSTDLPTFEALLDERGLPRLVTGLADPHGKEQSTGDDQ
jgi:hypothetical protein